MLLTQLRVLGTYTWKAVTLARISWQKKFECVSSNTVSISTILCRTEKFSVWSYWLGRVSALPHCKNLPVWNNPEQPGGCYWEAGVWDRLITEMSGKRKVWGRHIQKKNQSSFMWGKKIKKKNIFSQLLWESLAVMLALCQATPPSFCSVVLDSWYQRLLFQILIKMRMKLKLSQGANLVICFFLLIRANFSNCKRWLMQKLNVCSCVDFI